jgi:tryptophanyl-tRNA synthetase
VDFETAGAGVRNLLGIFQAFSEWTDDRVKAHFTGMRYGEMKKQVAEMMISHLEPFQKRYREIVGEPGYISGVLREGGERVSPIANATVDLVKRRMGLYALS